MSQSFECFRVEVDDHVAIVTIDRAPVNAQNRTFREEIVQIFDWLGDRQDVRAIVLTGAGKTFSAGADLRERPALSQTPGAYAAHNRLVRASFDAVLSCAKPVIAAINGAAIGAGCVLATCCDILLASDAAYMQMTEVNVGLAGGVAHIRRHFGESDARLFILTARRMSGSELFRMGVTSACTSAEDLMPAALSIARDIAAKSPSAVRAAKKSFGLTENLSLEEGYRFEQSQTVALAGTKDTSEALAAFAEKRTPIFD